MIDSDKLQQEMENFRSSIPIMIQHAILSAQITRAKYDALLKEGFTEKQAIELCRTNT